MKKFILDKQGKALRKLETRVHNEINYVAFV